MIGIHVRRGIIVAGLCLTLVAGSAVAAQGLQRITSNHDVATTAERLADALEARGMSVFTRIDHAAGAATAGMNLPPTRLILFGTPAVGTRLMQCGRSVAIDLPMKMLVWSEGGTVYIGYNTPDYLAARHGLTGCETLLAKVADTLNTLARDAAE